MERWSAKEYLGDSKRSQGLKHVWLKEKITSFGEPPGLVPTYYYFLKEPPVNVNVFLKIWGVLGYYGLSFL
jgi:hypothetical protein